MKRLLFLFLVLAALMITSCSGDVGNGSESEALHTEDIEVTDKPLPPPLTILNSAGKTDYKLIISSDASGRVRSAVNDMRGYFYSTFSTQIWLKRDSETAESATEILVGVTDRKESASAIAALEEGTYSISVEGSKIVIAANSDDGVETAVKYFIETYLSVPAAGGTLTVEDAVGQIPEYFELLRSGWNDMRNYSFAARIDINYQIYKPRNYDSTKKYPILLFLHGNGSRGDDNISHINNTGGTVVRTVTSLAEYKNDVIIIAPQCKNGEQWVDADPKKGNYTFQNSPAQCMNEVIALLDFWLGHISYDSDRIYLWGNSMGAFGCWDLMCRYPDRFAGAVCVCGCGDLKFAPKLTHINISIHHGTEDTTVPFNGNYDMYNSILDAGGEKVSFTSYEGKDHNISGITGSDRALIDWLFSCTK